MKKITHKILSLTIGSVLFLGILLSSFMMYGFKRMADIEIKGLGDTMRQDYDLLIKSEIESVMSLLNYNYGLYRQGVISEEEARIRCADVIRNARYGDDSYFWADTSDGTNVVYLGKDTEGTNRWDTQDTNGTYLIREIIDVAMKGGGFTDYYFPRGSGGASLPKRSYSAYFEPFDWIIGTGNYVDDIDTVLEAKKLSSQQRFVRNIITYFIFVTVCLVIIIIMTLVLGKKISDPIVLAAQHAQTISEGDLTLNCGEEMVIKYKDEIGTLLKALMAMSQNLNEMVGVIRESSVQVSSGADQISETTQQLADGAARQASGVEEISSSMEELTVNIQESRSHATEADRIARKVSEEAEEGGRSVNETVQAMSKIAERISVIEGIAAQTNMLALNAAIEAARAGDAGKGFSVVAAEVKKLAENSGKAAGEIIEITETSMAKATHAGELINQLVPQILQTSELVQEITMAGEQQQAGAQEINGGIRQLDEVIQLNAASSEELASMAEELAAQSKMLRDNMDYFKICDYKAQINHKKNRNAKKSNKDKSNTEKAKVNPQKEKVINAKEKKETDGSSKEHARTKNVKPNNAKSNNQSNENKGKLNKTKRKKTRPAQSPVSPKSSGSSIKSSGEQGNKKAADTEKRKRTESSESVKRREKEEFERKINHIDDNLDEEDGFIVF